MLKMKMVTINQRPNVDATTACKTPQFVATISLPEQEQPKEENEKSPTSYTI
jgi:hypothetical protein